MKPEMDKLGRMHGSAFYSPGKTQQGESEKSPPLSHNPYQIKSFCQGGKSNKRISASDRATTDRFSTLAIFAPSPADRLTTSEEHTSELQSRQYLVCRLL